MNNSKLKRHSYLCNFPLNLWAFINDQASKRYLTVAAYLNQLVFEEWQRCSYGEGGLFPSDQEEEASSPCPADSAGVDCFEKKVGDIVCSKDEGRGVIRDIDYEKRTFAVHFYEDDFISADTCSYFFFNQFNKDNFLLNWYEKPVESVESI